MSSLNVLNEAFKAKEQ